MDDTYFDFGADYQGDPRCCPRHPDQPTSSPDGMFDAPCAACEGEHDAADGEADYYAAAVKRYTEHARQGTLFEPEPMKKPEQKELL